MRPVPETPAVLPKATASPVPGGEIVPDELLTVRPRPLNLGRLESPEFRRLPAAGRVVLELTVRKNGKASNIRVAYTDLPGPILAHVMNMFLFATYAPGEVAGSAVDSILRVEVGVTEGGTAVVGDGRGAAPLRSAE